MVQPKYSPEEALQRIKLMMEYDTSKTLNENVETIKQPINEIAPLLGLIPMALPWLIGYGTAAAAGIGTWIYNVQGGGDAFSKAQTFFAGCSSLDPKLEKPPINFLLKIISLTSPELERNNPHVNSPPTSFKNS
jgi:hypothetical protein